MFMTRILMTTTVTAVLGVALIGQAAASNRPDDRSGLRGTELSSQVAYPDAVDRAVAIHKASPLRPNDRQLAYPDAVDRAVATHKARLAKTVMSAQASQTGAGFDWGAAGIGASTISALLLLSVGGFALVRKNRPVGGV
jgi:hypothetical protein